MTYPTRSWSAYPAPVHPCIAILLHRLISYQWCNVHPQCLPCCVLMCYSACSAHGTFCTSHVQFCPGAQLWAAAKTMVHQQEEVKQQGGRQTAQLAGSKTGGTSPRQVQLTRRPSHPTGGAKESKRSKFIKPVSQLFGRSGLCACLQCSRYQCAAGSIFQRTASAEPDLSSADCDLVPSLVESADSESDVDEYEDPQKQH